MYTIDAQYRNADKEKNIVWADSVQSMFPIMCKRTPNAIQYIYMYVENVTQNRHTRQARSFIIDSCQYWRSCKCMFNNVGMTIISSNNDCWFEYCEPSIRASPIRSFVRLCVRSRYRIASARAYRMRGCVLRIFIFFSSSYLYSIHNAHSTLYNILFY